MRALIERLEGRSIEESSDLGITGREPPKIRGLKGFMRGRGRVPKGYEDWHEELAKESLDNLKKRFGIKVLKTEMGRALSSPMDVVYADIQLKDGTKKTLRWGAGFTGGGWSVKLQHGWGSVTPRDFENG
jgi:hypothetical protein